MRPAQCCRSIADTIEAPRPQRCFGRGADAAEPPPDWQKSLFSWPKRILPGAGEPGSSVSGVNEASAESRARRGPNTNRPALP